MNNDLKTTHQNDKQTKTHCQPHTEQPPPMFFHAHLLEWHGANVNHLVEYLPSPRQGTIFGFAVQPGFNTPLIDGWNIIVEVWF